MTEGTSEAFEVKTGVRQGGILSPLDRIVKRVVSVLGGGIRVHVDHPTREDCSFGINMR